MLVDSRKRLGEARRQQGGLRTRIPLAGLRSRCAVAHLFGIHTEAISDPMLGFPGAIGPGVPVGGWRRGVPGAGPIGAFGGTVLVVGPGAPLGGIGAPFSSSGPIHVGMGPGMPMGGVGAPFGFGAGAVMIRATPDAMAGLMSPGVECSYCDAVVHDEEDANRAGSHHQPSCPLYDQNTRTGPLRLQVLHEGSDEYRRVQQKLNDDQSHIRLPTVRYIKRVHGHDLCSRVRSNVKELWHGTAAGGATNILNRGFRLPASAGAFGPGIYFASESCKSISYGNELLLCKVALGRVGEVTTVDNSITLDALIRQDFDSLHHDPAQGPFSHHEFVVFRASQAIPTHTVEYSGTVGSC